MDWSPLWISLATSVTATAITLVVGLAAAVWRERHSGAAAGVSGRNFPSASCITPHRGWFFSSIAFRAAWTLRSAAASFWRDDCFFLACHSNCRDGCFISAHVYHRARGAGAGGTGLLEAARTLGATEWRVFREIALPLAWPGVLAGTILSFARALGEFGATLMIAGNIPGRTETIPIAIYFAVEADDIQRALYWCAVDVIISLALLSGLYLWTRTQGFASARRPAH